MASDTPIDRLYGLPGEEEMDAHLADTAERVWDHAYDQPGPGSATIEEWDVHPPIDHLPTASLITEWIAEWVYDVGEVVDGFEVPQDDPDAIAKAEELRTTLASKIGWRMARRRVAQHVVEWDGDGSEPTVDGRPLSEVRGG